MGSPIPSDRQSGRVRPSTRHPYHARLAVRAQEDSNYESKKKDVIYNVQVLYEDRVRKWSRHI
jgi:hypothetical protein